MDNMKSKKKQPFIITTDIDTKNILLGLGYTLISDDNNRYMFLNDSHLRFDKNGNEIKLNKMCYTNVMCMQES